MFRNLGQQQDPTRLGDRFHHQHTRHDGIVRKMTLEEWFIDGNVLDRHDAPPGADLEHAVDQEKRDNGGAEST